MKAKTLLEIIKRKKTVKEDDLKRAVEAQIASGKKLQQVLIDDGLMAEKDLMLLLSHELGIPVLNLASFKVESQIAKAIPKKVATRYEILPVSRIGNTITLAMSDPLDVFAIDDVKNLTQCDVRIAIATSQDIQTAIESFYTDEMKLEDVLEDLDPDSVEVVGEGKGREEAGDAYVADGAPVIRMVNLMLQEAIKTRASDIHFEPYADRVRIRYRVDGALGNAFQPPRDMYSAILTRLKIVSELDITERRLPQDGRFKARFESREIDFRVSILPTYHGEKVVLRVLDKASIKAGLEYLGFTAESIQALQKPIARPYGLVLVTGPTGSGKSTTLYSILNQLNTTERNIMTIEDPIEYQIDGITQTQVKPDIGLSFSDGLRSILRQSPDIILVGEIRDNETADIAVKAALTGHLVFSTLHTNNASGAITRLVDMGVEPFLIASSLIAATAQRLMRRLCEECRKECSLPENLIERMPVDRSWFKDVVFYKTVGCQNCRQSGYRGRLGTMEVLPLDEEVQQLIIEGKSTNEIEAAAQKKGMKCLFEDALMAVRKGQTTLEEVLRVATFEE